MKNETRYELNEETGKYDVYYRGFDYNTFSRHDWKKVGEKNTEDEAKKFCADALDFGD